MELSDYNARFYDHSIGRFISADTIVPDPSNPQAWNRYSYVYNNPIKYNDPSGHSPGLLALIASPPVAAALLTIGVAGYVYLASNPDAVNSVANKAANFFNPQYREGWKESVPLESSTELGIETFPDGGEVGGTILTTPLNDGAHESNVEIFPNNSVPDEIRQPYVTSSSWTQHSGRFPQTASPDSTLYRANEDGTITSYQVYDGDGHRIKRVDMTGAPHAGVDTPHVIDYKRNPIPYGGFRTGPVSKIPRDRTPEEEIWNIDDIP